VIFLAAVTSLGWTTLRGRSDSAVTIARDQFLTARLVLEETAAGSQARGYQSAYHTIADKLR
jgi:hypothetical protein